MVPFSSGYKNNNGFLKGVMEDRWTVDNPNPNARYPRTIRPSDALDNNNTKKSSFWVRNAAYLRLKNAGNRLYIPKEMDGEDGYTKFTSVCIRSEFVDLGTGCSSVRPGTRLR